MNFKTISIVKFPTELVWDTMLHNLPDIAEGVKELKSITEKKRSAVSAGVIKVVNEWSADPNLPSIISKHIKPAMLMWTDTAVWNEKGKKIIWNIVSHHFLNDMNCEGYTLFEPAMGDKGCRLTFGGQLQWDAKLTSLGVGILDKTISKTIEAVLVQMIPSNFRKITEALSDYISQKPVKRR